MSSPNFKAKALKLYFDVTMADAITNAVFPCTQITNGTPGDRYGHLLDVNEACIGGTPPQVKARRAVSAWFQPVGSAGLNATTPLAFLYDVRFVQPTSAGTNKAALLGLPFFTGATTTTVPGKIGAEAIYGTNGSLRHFAVQVQKRHNTGAGVIGLGTLSVHGVLYVQRQHSIEV